jgi:hypothetical protein
MKSKPAGPGYSALVPHKRGEPLDDTEILVRLAERIIAAGTKGRGCVVTAREAQLLLQYNLPCTADNPRVVTGS